jgi:thiol-disulfide isomerase/thioredoxin
MRRPRRAVPAVAGLLLAGAAAAACALAAAALAACSGSGGGQQAGQNFVAGDGAITIVAPARRPTPGPLRGTTVEGQTVDLADYKGHAVVLNVWGSWCAPCQQEAPALQAASRQLASKGVRFLGINTRETGGAPAASAFERTYGITYPSLFDQGADYLLALRGAVAANAIPSTVVVDPQGRIAARISGPTTKETLVDLVDDVLSGRASSS